MSRVTLSDIAAELGVSTMTVSRAMRDQPGVAHEMRERIKETAQRLGYCPDPEMGRLMRHLRRGSKAQLKANLCAVTNFPPGEEPRYSARLCRYAAEHAQALGFRFSLIRVSSVTGDWSATLRMMKARGVAGVLLLPMVGPTELSALDWSGLSVVSATSSVTQPRFHEVAPNHSANARLMIDHLAARGYRRIGYVGLTPHAQRTREALPAALAWHHARHQVRCEPLLFMPDEPMPDIVVWAQREQPEVILVGRPPDQPGFQQALERAGIRVAWALANSRAFFDYAPGLDERDDLIGVCAVSTLSDLFVRAERGIPEIPTSISITGQWVDPQDATMLR
ncbi:MAG: LacI family transcriptional regulator [Puniceicoccaceae bacterium 5H]|nr:MAG: LacI family transcriptional regulator [Puniceicoccaceae bacterium 5H]